MKTTYSKMCPTLAARIGFMLGMFQERGYKYPVATMLTRHNVFQKEDVCRVARAVGMHVRKTSGEWYESNRLIDDIVKLKKLKQDGKEESTN
jgi:hypothetical protein